MGPRAGLDGRKTSFPTGIRSQTVQPVAQSLYRLSYRAHNYENYSLLKYRVFIVCNYLAARVSSRLGELLLEVKGANRN